MNSALPESRRPCRAIVVIGPSGSGKSTLGKALAARTGYRFLEGDDRHPPENLRKLAAGVPLEDADRWPFLDDIGQAMKQAGGPVIVSCSALRPMHRERLRQFVADMLVVWVDVPEDELERRMRQRQGHFMPPSLLADQIMNFEPPVLPERFLRLDGNLPTGEQVQAVLEHLGTDP